MEESKRILLMLETNKFLGEQIKIYNNNMCFISNLKSQYTQTMTLIRKNLTTHLICNRLLEEESWIHIQLSN